MENYRGSLIQLSIEAVSGHISFNIGIFAGMEYSGEYIKLTPCPKNIVENAGSTLKEHLLTHSNFMTQYDSLVPANRICGIQILEENAVGEETAKLIEKEQAKVDAKS